MLVRALTGWVFLLTSGLVAGALAFGVWGRVPVGRRAARLARREAARDLGSAAPLATVAALGALLVGRLAGASGSAQLEPLTLLFPGALSAAAALATSAAFLFLRAGRVEARGRLAAARRAGRLAGMTLFPATLAVAALAVASGRPALWPGALVGTLGGLAGLLAGLAGKPRPGGAVAALAWAAALLALLAAA